MADWNSDRYLKFKKQRTQPAIDLAARVSGSLSPKKVIDIGCGPGNSTAVLKSSFPDADILGIDNSPNMIEKARSAYPVINFERCDARDIATGYDLIFSNACLQWLSDHKKLLPSLMDKLCSGGMLAVQIPINTEEPLFKIIDEVASDPKWNFDKSLFEVNKTLSQEDYFDILSDCSDEFDIWETVYYHNMPDCQSLVEWVKGTRLRPYLDALSENDAELFENEILQRTAEVYRPMKNSEIILRFRRLFFTAKKV